MINKLQHHRMYSVTLRKFLSNKLGFIHTNNFNRLHFRSEQIRVRFACILLKWLLPTMTRKTKDNYVQ